METSWAKACAFSTTARTETIRCAFARIICSLGPRPTTCATATPRDGCTKEAPIRTRAARRGQTPRCRMRSLLRFGDALPLDGSISAKSPANSGRHPRRFGWQLPGKPTRTFQWWRCERDRDRQTREARRPVGFFLLGPRLRDPTDARHLPRVEALPADRRDAGRRVRRRVEVDPEQHA